MGINGETNMFTVKVIKSCGKIAIEESQRFRQEIRGVADTKPSVLVIDLKDVTFLDSIGLGALVAALNAMKAIGSRLILLAPSEAVRFTLKISNMEKAFQIYDDYIDLQ
jgi:anti-sigma B factor antagonist